MLFGSIDIAYIISLLVVILFSMTLHEAMHGFMAYWLGDDTAKMEGRLTLNPIKHIDPFLTILLPLLLAATGAPIFGGAKPVPFNPMRVKYDEWGAALIALAGPLTNLLIAFLCYGIIAAGAAEVSGLGQFLYLAVVVNLGFFIFNMLPIPPLDGSRALYAIAPDFIRSAMLAIERYGIIFVFLIVMIASKEIGSYIVSVISAILGVFQTIFAFL